jgi:hypothetical protein
MRVAIPWSARGCPKITYRLSTIASREIPSPWELFIPFCNARECVLSRRQTTHRVLAMSQCESILSDFLTKKELATELRRNPRTLDRWQILGEGPPRTLVGRQVLYRRASVVRWLTAQEQRGRMS